MKETGTNVAGGRKIYQISEINRYIKNLLEDDVILSDIFVEAEVSNFKRHTSGHLYFTLKDAYAAVNCVMFKGYSSELPFIPENGMKVIAYGRVSIYEKTGQYQLYLEYMEPAGKGALYLAFEQIKERLQKEGLFDLRHKKEIPVYPKTIALITSPTGAAVRDLISVARRRNRSVKLVLLPVLVQGTGAAVDIEAAIGKVNAWRGADVIILGRGGGSIEDLWAFNEERVARAIFKSKIPVVSAVGHETDYTIADFVADLRAPTPSAAAELCVPELQQLTGFLAHSEKQMHNAMETRILESKRVLQRILSRRAFKYPLDLIFGRQLHIAALQRQLDREMENRLEKNKMILTNLTNAMEKTSPVALLKKGYTLVYDCDGTLVKGIGQLSENDTLRLQFSDGRVEAAVIGIEEYTE